VRAFAASGHTGCADNRAQPAAAEDASVCVNGVMKLTVAVAALSLTACQVGAATPAAESTSASESTPAAQATPAPEPQDAATHGSLSSEEFSRAVEAAKKVQSTVRGTFVGATATAVDEPDQDLDQGCPDERLVHIRLVWMADANFDHGGVPGAQHDGPRKAALVTMDAATGQVCAQGAQYRNVGARADEVLLYGSRP